MIHYGRQHISQSDIDSVIEVLKSDFITQGPVVPIFETNVANYCGANHAIATNSATAALHIACLALEIGPGDIVWTSSSSFVSSSNCALFCGAKVDFVDIDPNTYNMSVEKLSEKLADAKIKGLLPKVIIPVHLCGQSCDMKAIYNLSKKYNFKIIEDASHAIGGKYKNKPVGSCEYSDITVFSFHPVKIITTGEGGMALTNDSKLFNLLKMYRSHGITSDNNQMLSRPNDEIWNYQQLFLGFNYRMTDIQAALGNSQIKRLDEIVEARHRIANKYHQAFKDLPIQIPWQHPLTYSSYHLYPIRVNYQQSNKNQQTVYDLFLDSGINVNLHYIPIYRQPYYEALGFKAGHCPESEKYYKETISIPLYPTLTSDEQNRVIKVLLDIFK
jgi:UDP-4-amino-4,6-dideoxy-N-acetyl-beta-L-altrosamine transaminase